MNFRLFDAQTVGISLDETTAEKDVMDILAVFNGGKAPALATSATGAQSHGGLSGAAGRGPALFSSKRFLTRIIRKRKCSVICGGWKAVIYR